MKISLIDAVGMTITAVVGIIALTYGIVKGGMDLKTFGYISSLNSKGKTRDQKCLRKMICTFGIL